jgi:GT2 family glycosyltransferase
MTHQNDTSFPFVSVLVVTFNRGKVMQQCLQSLSRQTYPRDRYEIIVIDDASTDDTAYLAETEGARVISHPANKGIPSARNTGMQAATGDIIAYIDDDAIADPQWLEHLIQPFHRADVIGSGGQTFAYKTETLAEKYLAAVGYGNPAPLAFGQSKNPLWRFWVYVKNMFMPVYRVREPVEVQAVFGLNCAFRTAALHEIGGFDETLMADEDSEISTRLRQHGAHIIFIPDAIIYHRHRESLAYLIRQTYRRAQYTVYYYAKERKTLPIFPFPLLYFVVTIVLLIIQPFDALVFFLIAPVFLYSWWVVRAIRERKFDCLMFGYIQLMLESAAITGMIGGTLHA